MDLNRFKMHPMCKSPVLVAAYVATIKSYLVQTSCLWTVGLIVTYICCTGIRPNMLKHKNKTEVSTVMFLVHNFSKVWSNTCKSISYSKWAELKLVITELIAVFLKWGSVFFFTAFFVYKKEIPKFLMLSKQKPVPFKMNMLPIVKIIHKLHCNTTSTYHA